MFDQHGLYKHCIDIADVVLPLLAPNFTFLLKSGQVIFLYTFTCRIPCATFTLLSEMFKGMWKHLSALPDPVLSGWWWWCRRHHRHTPALAVPDFAIESLSQSAFPLWIRYGSMTDDLLFVEIANLTPLFERLAHFAPFK